MLRKLTFGSVARAATASIARPRCANATSTLARNLSCFDATGYSNAAFGASRDLRAEYLPRRLKTPAMAGCWTASRGMSSASSQEEEVRAQLTVVLLHYEYRLAVDRYVVVSLPVE